MASLTLTGATSSIVIDGRLETTFISGICFKNQTKHSDYVNKYYTSKEENLAKSLTNHRLTGFGVKWKLESASSLRKSESISF